MLNDFHRYHQHLVLKREYDVPNDELVLQLNEWLSSDRLYLIVDGDCVVGYIHISYKIGDMVAKLEDIFVKQQYRGKGYASFAIDWIERNYNDKVKAIVIDVIPRNTDAIKIYHSLGYDNLSMISLRKELHGENTRDLKLELLGNKFNM